MDKREYKKSLEKALLCLIKRLENPSMGDLSRSDDLDTVTAIIKLHKEISDN